MNLFGFLTKKKRIAGSIGYFGLENWWISTFSEHERQYIEERFRPLGLPDNSLTSGCIEYTTETVVNFLTALAGWFSKKQDRYIAYKILEKAEQLAADEKRIIDIHFLYSEKIKIYYKDREDITCFEKAIEACYQQISIAESAAQAFRSEYKNLSLPAHKGYEQLSIILEKKLKYQEVINLCYRAAKQKWAGDWEKRIERCRNKLRKLQ